MCTESEWCTSKRIDCDPKSIFLSPSNMTLNPKPSIYFFVCLFPFQTDLDMTSRTVHVTGTCSTSTRLQLNSKSTRTSSCTPHPASQRKVLSTLTAVAWSRMTFPAMTSSILRRRFLPQPIILWWTSFASMRWRIFTITQVSVHFYWGNGKGCAYIENTMSTLHYVLSCFTDFHFFFLYRFHENIDCLEKYIIAIFDPFPTTGVTFISIRLRDGLGKTVWDTLGRELPAGKIPKELPGFNEHIN